MIAEAIPELKASIKNGEEFMKKMKWESSQPAICFPNLQRHFYKRLESHLLLLCVSFALTTGVLLGLPSFPNHGSICGYIKKSKLLFSLKKKNGNDNTKVVETSGRSKWCTWVAWLGTWCVVWAVCMVRLVTTGPERWIVLLYLNPAGISSKAKHTLGDCDYC